MYECIEVVVHPTYQYRTSTVTKYYSSCVVCIEVIVYHTYQYKTTITTHISFPYLNNHRENFRRDKYGTPSRIENREDNARGIDPVPGLPNTFLFHITRANPQTIAIIKP